VTSIARAGAAERSRWSQVGSTLRSSDKTVAGTSSRIANRIRIGSPPDELLRSELYQQRPPDGRKIRGAPANDNRRANHWVGSARAGSMEEARRAGMRPARAAAVTRTVASRPFVS
jgi:hypothetical protein